MNPQHRIDRVSRPEESPIPLEAEAASPPVKPSAARYAPVGAPASAAKPGPALPPRAKAEAAATPVCPKCGYSVVGLKGEVCPECGGKITMGAVRRAERAKQARADFKRSAVLAGLAAAACVGCLVGTLALVGRTADIAYYMTVYGIMVLLGVAFYWFLCFIMLGFDRPFIITALKIAAIFAFVDATGVYATFVPILFVQWVVMAALYIGLSAKWLEMEFSEAAMFGVGCVVLNVLVTVGVRIAGA